MIQPNDSLHFVGIAGTAMASVAAALKAQGRRVTGSDQGVYPPMSDFLEARDIEVATPYAASNLDGAPDHIVIGNAVSRGNPEVERALAERMSVVSLPELVYQTVLRRTRNLVVTGTHGKTTTASLLTWILESSGRKPSFLIGGIAENLGEGARFTDGEFTVVEGDEYDSAFFDKRSKFIHYAPEIAIFNNLEFDHADIFDSLDAVKKTFLHFVRLIPNNGLALINGDEPNLGEVAAFPHCPKRTFGFSANCNATISIEEPAGSEGARFRLSDTTFTSPLYGEFNVRNACAAILAARTVGVSDAEIQEALSSFRGIKRRMTIRGEVRGVTVIDDFAHHPTAIRETLVALKSRFPGRRIIAAFEPRSNTTRRRRFQSELAESLSVAHAAFIANVARIDQIPPNERLDIHQLSKDIQSTGAIAEAIDDTDLIAQKIIELAKEGDIVTVLSNGGFGGIHQKLLEGLARNP